MKIVVCMKQVPDSETQIKLAPDGGGVDLHDAQFVVNPYDEFALEEALRLKERFGGEVTVVTMGGDKAKEALRTCLAMGADRGVHLNDPAFAGCDSLGTAGVLAAALRKLEYDLILCGKQAIDDDCMHVGPQLAELLDLPQVCVVNKLSVAEDGTSAVAHRQIEGGSEVVSVTFPAVITCQKGLNEPRYPSLKGIMGAKKKPLDEWRAGELGIDPASVGAGAAAVQIRQFFPPPPRSAGRKIEGDPAHAAKELVRLLREEAKVV
ncbi:MAG: electron transfer flavoprotein subunit beta/FixA family protein [Candidatus Tectomicrobia bacterium]|nr:electron transfer flavoprotein subunit beta/FixA family protein [Candidatus Tectomicrobia bacterium]